MAQGFTRRFDTRLHFGSCVVYIPKSHDLGSIGSNFADRCVRIVAGLPKDERLKLLAVEEGTQESFVNDLAACMTQLEAANREILLFVHGYNVSFQDAAIRAAQVGRDLGIAGPVVFFSWPSFAFAPFYTPDEGTIDRTRRQFVEFIRILKAVPGIGALNVIAHSMGNRIREQTANILVESSHAEIQLGHIVLAAPDVDRSVILQAARDYARLRCAQRRTTLYWNRYDRAVGYLGYCITTFVAAGMVPRSLTLIQSCGQRRALIWICWGMATSRRLSRFSGTFGNS